MGTLFWAIWAGSGGSHGSLDLDGCSWPGLAREVGPTLFCLLFRNAAPCGGVFCLLHLLPPLFYGNKWVSLGTFPIFPATSNSYSNQQMI